MTVFSETLRDLMASRDMTVRALARQVPCDQAMICRYRSGKCLPSAKIAARLDAVLEAGGALVDLSRRKAMTAAAAVPLAMSPGLLGFLGDPERAARAVRLSRRPVDMAAVDCLRDLLAAQRHAEDALGAVAVLPAARAQLTAIEGLVRDAHGPVRTALLHVAQQWAQFCAWMHRDTGDVAGARLLLAQTLEWAAEISDSAMIATVLTERGCTSLNCGEVGSAIGLALAAQKDTTAAAGQRALGADLEACGHAMTGDYRAMERAIGRAESLSALLADRPQDRRPWSYWMTPALFEAERGVTLASAAAGNARYCDRAVMALESGYAALPEAQRSSAWASLYLAYLATVHARAGDVEQSCAVAMKCAQAARVPAAPRPTGMLRRLQGGLAARCPGDPRVAELGSVLEVSAKG